MMVPGRVEQWIVVADLADIGYTEMPVSNIRSFVVMSQKLFKNYNAKTYILNSGWIMKNGYNVMSTLLEPVVRNKQVFLGSDYKKVLVSEIGAQNLEQKYGGELPNKTQDFFPP